MRIAYLPRQALVTVNSGFVVNSGSDFGAKQVGGFTRITGLAFAVGSMSIRLRTGLAESGPFIVTSTWLVNSGVNIMDVPNYGSWVSIDVTAALSQSPTFSIFGEPLR